MAAKKAKKAVKKVFKAKPEKKKSNLGTYILFVVVVLIALFLRTKSADWTNDRQFHPDERWIVSNAVPSLSYPGKPIGLQYGSLPLYILAARKDMINFFHSKGLIKDMNKALIGGARKLSGLVDTGTLIFIFFTALILFGPKIALLSSVLLAFTVLHIHAGHFFTVDTFVTFFVAGTIYFSARIYKKGTLVNYILAAVFYGAALASKTAAMPVGLVIFTAHLLYFFSLKAKTRAESERKKEAWINMTWAVLITAVAFFVFMPYAILDFNKFTGDQNYQKNILVTGEGDVPYNRQYRNTTPYLYQINNLVKYTMGIPYGTAALIALLFYVFMFFKNLIKHGQIKDKDTLLILAWVVPFFLIIGMSFAKFNRYLIPMTPFLAILTAKFLYDLYEKTKFKKSALVIRYVVVAGAVFYGLAFMNIYNQKHTWVQASEWFYRDVPAVDNTVNPPKQTTVLNEMWGDDLPTYAANGHPGMYRGLHWALQEPDTTWKYEELSSKLSQSDYVVMADRRAKGTYLRLPQKYPINYFYYTTMLSNPEKLGFKLAYEKAVYPSLFGIDIIDDKSDESFQLYDHPHVHVFKNEAYLSKEQLRELIIKGESEVKAKFGAQQSFKKEKGAFNANIGKVRDIITPVMPYLSVFLWYVLIQVLALIIWPMHSKVFGSLKDKGYGLAKISGLFVFTWINWIMVSAKVWNFYQINLWILLFAAAALSIWYTLKNRKETAEFYSANRQHIILTETLFLAAYMLFVIVKLWTPDIHNVPGHGYNGGGEPMGMAYLSAIFNGVTFPPMDPWLSGYTLNYYYWGQLMLATASKLLGIFPRVTYNLSLSILFALSFIAAFSLAYSMTGKRRFGIFGGLLLACAGNFHTLEFIFNAVVSAGNLLRIPSLISRFQFIWDPTRIYPSPAITEVPFFSYLYGDLHAHNIVIPVTVLAIALLFALFKNAEKGGGIMSALGNNYPQRVIMAFMLALTLGGMLTINTWNFPPVFLLYGLVFAAVSVYYLISVYNVKRNRPGIKPAVYELLKVTVVLIIIAGFSYLLYLPFHSAFQSPYNSGPKFISKPERATFYQMFKYFSVFFVVICAYSLYVIYAGGAKIAEISGALKIKKWSFKKAGGNVSKILEKIFDSEEVSVPFTLALVIAAAAAALSFFLQPTFGPLLIMMAVMAWRLFETKDTAERFSLMAVFLALGIVLGTEILYVADGRMNTVFKFYMVAWTMLAVAVPQLFNVVYSRNVKHFKFSPKSVLLSSSSAFVFLAVSFALYFIDFKNGGNLFETFFILTVIFSGAALAVLRNKAGKFILMGGFIFIMLPAVLYPIMGSAIKMSICNIEVKEAYKHPRIDGLAFMEKLERRPGADMDYDKFDYKAIDWINKNLNKIEPVLEAPGERMYSGASRLSIYTGIPTLVGWGYQVSQQSGRGTQVNERNNDAAFIYRTNDINAALEKIKKYGIRYVYVGNIERGLYPDYLGKFNMMGEAVYRNEMSALYKINY